jgi:hypothetical protein
VIISRRDVLLAIAAETLWPQSWVEQLGNPGCRVCALGAVLRLKGWNNRDIMRDAPVVARMRFDPADNLNFALTAENYLGALSIYFERLCEKGATIDDDEMPAYVEKTVKPALRSFVLEHFPAGIIYSDED